MRIHIPFGKDTFIRIEWTFNFYKPHRVYKGQKALDMLHEIDEKLE